MCAGFAGIHAFVVYLPTFATRELKLPSSGPFYGLLLYACLGTLLALTFGIYPTRSAASESCCPLPCSP
jgi:hypothetical protein